jgi:hypothetical protein
MTITGSRNSLYLRLNADFGTPAACNPELASNGVRSDVLGVLTLVSGPNHAADHFD